MTKGNLCLLVAVLGFGARAFAGPLVYGESPMVKIRPQIVAGTGTAIDLAAAQNEFVSFQVVVRGADTGASQVRAAFPSLDGPASISGNDLTLYREAYLNVVTP